MLSNIPIAPLPYAPKSTYEPPLTIMDGRRILSGATFPPLRDSSHRCSACLEDIALGGATCTVETSIFREDGRKLSYDRFFSEYMVGWWWAVLFRNTL